MAIDYHDVFPILANTLPDFPAAEDDWEDRLCYIFISDMVRFVCQQTTPSTLEAAGQFATTLEKLTLEGDNETRYLVMDALERVAEHDEKGLVASQFGPITRALWDRMPF